MIAQVFQELASTAPLPASLSVGGMVSANEAQQREEAIDDEHQKFANAIESVLEPLCMLTDATRHPAQMLPLGVARDALLETFESRLTEFFLLFVEST
jgi:hypothetical protein